MIYYNPLTLGSEAPRGDIIFPFSEKNSARSIPPGACEKCRSMVPYLCALLNIIEKGPKVYYGVPRLDP